MPSIKQSTIKLGLIQLQAGNDMRANTERAYALAQMAAKKGAHILCLPELYNTVYFPQLEKADKDYYAETVPGFSTATFCALAKKYKVVVIVPLYEKKKVNGIWKYFNSAVVINEKGQILDTYHKIHIPHDPGFYEKYYFEESKSGYRVYKTSYATFAVLICYDQWFPEAARAARLNGAEIIFYPTAIGNVVGYAPPEGDWHASWELMMRSHAIANCVHVAAVNRVGREERMRFWGQSFVSDAFGTVVDRATSSKEQVLIVPVNLGMNHYIEDGWGFLRNRRPDTYGMLTSKKLIEKSKKLKNI
ncbi:acyltransferase [Candidatus Uhrbacteria bacterium]|nr:acyltransferase [Candidatus Uhrbacteria bacterium]